MQVDRSDEYNFYLINTTRKVLPEATYLEQLIGCKDNRMVNEIKRRVTL